MNGADMLGGEIATGGTPSNMGNSGPFPQIGYPFETDKVVLQLLQMLNPLGVNQHFSFGQSGRFGRSYVSFPLPLLLG